MKFRCLALCVLLISTAFVNVAAADRFDDSVRAVVSGAKPLEIAKDLGIAVRDEGVQVVAVSDGSETTAIEDWLRSNGSTFVLAVRGRVQAFVPPSLLVELSQRSDVVSVERPNYAELPNRRLRPRRQNGPSSR